MYSVIFKVYTFCRCWSYELMLARHSAWDIFMIKLNGELLIGMGVLTID